MAVQMLTNERCTLERQWERYLVPQSVFYFLNFFDLPVYCYLCVCPFCCAAVLIGRTK